MGVSGTPFGIPGIVEQSGIVAGDLFRDADDGQVENVLRIPAILLGFEVDQSSVISKSGIVMSRGSVMLHLLLLEDDGVTRRRRKQTRIVNYYDNFLLFPTRRSAI